jgi:hypothetical protein
MLRRFQDLLARLVPLDLVIDEESAAGDAVTVSRGSVCGAWGGVTGTIRYFADRFGVARAAIEGTQLPYDLMRQYARAEGPDLVYDADRKRSPLALIRRQRYFGFELDREIEPLEEIPPELRGAARGVLVEALMTGRARHRDARALRHTLERMGELYRRAGGDLTEADGSAVRAELGRRLAGVTHIADFSRADLALEVDRFVSARRRRELEALPAWLDLAGERCPLDYEVQDGVAMARVRLRERTARDLRVRDLPVIDRPLVFTVLRGKRSALRVDSLEEMRRLLSARAPDPPSQGRARRRRRRP